MSLISAVEAICARLATDNGWYTLFLHHGLDITAHPLAAELTKSLSVDRNLQGFEDFSHGGQRAIEAGNPARSLLFHALASPNVRTDPSGKTFVLFPTPAEIYTVLTYVYGVRPRSLAELQAQAGADTVLGIVVFAMEYRPRPDTVHKKYADMCYSRTGIARVGTDPEHYDPQQRGFLPWVAHDPQAICVTPARFLPFIAMQKKGDAADFGPQPFQPTDAERDFWIPLHLLFNGAECIAEHNLQVTLESYLINEKIRQFHRKFPLSGWSEPDISNPPFVVTKDLAAWADANRYGPGLLLPEPKPQLVEKAVYRGADLTFYIPPNPQYRGYIINRRHKKRPDGSIEDLNTRADVQQIVSDGDYHALHFVDYTAEGSVQAICPQLEQIVACKAAAYSLVSAPDSYPLYTQRQLQEWSTLQSFPQPFFGNSLKVLADVRASGNPDLPGGHFTLADTGITAIVCQTSDPDEPATQGIVEPARRQTTLPDAGAGTLSPGWDISGPDGGGPRPPSLLAFELGSPFTDDWKKCSEVGGYWPAVSADTSRNYEPSANRISIIPLTDQETGQTPWDGVVGPELIDWGDGKRFVQYQSNAHVDYTKNAVAGLLMVHPLAQTSTEDYQARIVSMHRAFVLLGASNRTDKAQWSVLSFSIVVRPDVALEQAEAATGTFLAEPVHAYRIYNNGRLAPTIPAHDFTLRHAEILEMFEFFVGPTSLLMRREQEAWQAHDPI